CLCPTITLSPDTLPSATLGSLYNQTVTAIDGGVGPFQFSVSGSLPPGLTFSPTSPTTGAISGVPTTAGSFSFTITATDANFCLGSRAYTIAITAPAPTPAPPATARPSNNTARNVALVVGGLAGLGVLIGREATKPRCTPITIYPSNPALPPGRVGQPYNQTFTTSDGAFPHGFTVNGAPPPGLIPDSGGILSGSPTTAGSFTFSVATTDAKNCGGERAYTLVISPPPPEITINPETLPAGTAGRAYNQTLTAAGGAAPHSLSVTSGSLPAGLTLAAAGLISGTPTAAGTYYFTVLSADRNGYTATRDYAITVNPPCATLTITPATLPDGEVGQTYSQTLKPSGGAGPFTFSLATRSLGAQASLPAGLSLDPATGSISGTPSRASTSDFTIRATDPGGCTVAIAYSLRIAPGRFTTVSAANHTPLVAPKEIVAGFGSRLAGATVPATWPQMPTSLDRMRVMVKDSAGVERAAPMLLISPRLITYQIPDGAAPGAATVSVFRGSELVAEGTAQIVRPRPPSAPRPRAARRRRQ
ncbi:MAG TPA: putative Ig domain-containing protein, partial [Blastocatellia bacterium]|nr:putative Ig domain-containing protein [Blastocatellia bacterium]